MSKLSLALGWILVGAASVAAQTPAAGDPHREVRGVTISCQTWGWEWGSDAMVEALREVRALGANWVLIHPYARIGNDGSVTSRHLEGEAPKWLTRPIEEAHRLGLKVALKPHLAYWGSKFSWRGEIAFEDEAAWARFFGSYRAWLERVVEQSAGADAVVVGTELDRTLGHEAEWRSLIRAVRARTKAPLTYAANWTDYTKVPFWDALDVIGVQAYFPLVKHPRLPSPDELAQGWAKVLEPLRRFAKQQGKRVLFTELGYNDSASAAREPWGYQQGGPQADETQRRCYEVALRTLAREEVLCGAFLWKWFPGSARGEDFLLSRPPVREEIRLAWGAHAPQAPK
ncbi:MAG: hypothetical protein KDD82_05065 [Planctomycetes bacterium]|nr:hypothetical protein [Planctomycetota bacterium]